MHDDDLEPHPEPQPTFARPTLLNSCARAATASEARFRVPYANSLPRVSSIIALDAAAAAMMAAISEDPWKGARFLTLAQQPDISPNEVLLTGPDGAGLRLTDELATTDLVVMIATESRAEKQAETIGRLARGAAVMTAGIVVAGIDVDAVVQALRPNAAVLVIASDADYLPAMLTAMRA